MEKQIGFNPELAAALRAAREAAGLTEEKAARLACVTRQWINSNESGRVYQPDYDRLKRIARVYGVKPSHFLKLAHYPVNSDVDVEDEAQQVFSAITEIGSYLRRLVSEDNGDPKHPARQTAKQVVRELKRELEAIAV